MIAARCRVFLPIKPPKHRQAYHCKLLYHTLVHENMSARTDTRLMHIIDTPAPVTARHKALHAQNAMRGDARNRGLLHAELFCKSCQTDVLQFSVEIVSAPELFTSSHAPRGRFFPLSLLSRIGGTVLANFLNIFLKMLKKFYKSSLAVIIYQKRDEIIFISFSAQYFCMVSAPLFGNLYKK